MKFALRQCLLAGTALAGAAIAGVAGSQSAAAFPAIGSIIGPGLSNDCAAFSNNNSGFTCGVLITVTGNTPGTATATASVIVDPNNANPPAVLTPSHAGTNWTYDALFGDDVVVGLQNKSSFNLSSIGLTGSGNGGGSFGFDGDGGCASGLVTVGTCSPPPPAL